MSGNSLVIGQLASDLGHGKSMPLASTHVSTKKVRPADPSLMTPMRPEHLASSSLWIGHSRVPMLGSTGPGRRPAGAHPKRMRRSMNGIPGPAVTRAADI